MPAEMIIYLTILLIGFCAELFAAEKEIASNASKNQQVDQHALESKAIPKTEELIISMGKGKDKEVKLSAVFWEPKISKRQKIAVIIAPGYDNTSYRAPRSGDGKNIYPKAIDVGTLWQQSFADQGFYVFAYDKRTCSPEYDAKCPRYATDDIDALGPKALSNDLDKACEAVEKRLGKKAKIVLLTENQGTQVLLGSKCLKNASAAVILSPIPGALNKMWPNALKEAKEEFRAENMENIFETIASLSITSTKIFGHSTQFWRKWIMMSKETPKDLKKSSTPMLFVVGKDDPTVCKEGLTVLSNIANGKNKILLKLTDADKNLLAATKISHSALKQIVDTVEKIAKKD